LSASVLSTKPVSDTDIARVRREQIVEAAVEIIASQGLHNLSLSKIETRAGMKRGQLTYYFPTKEDILLAVFDRLLLLLYEQFSDGQNPNATRGVPDLWDCVQKMLQTVLHSRPKFGKEFHSLQFTFLAQIAHREDFRAKLATYFAEWRQWMSAHWQVSAKPQATLAKNVSGQTVSSFVQALMHGLGVQLAADPNAFDRTEMLTLCVGVLAPLFTHPPAGEPATERPT
jgi:AcrR family transcriptional regulator